MMLTSAFAVAALALAGRPAAPSGAGTTAPDTAREFHWTGTVAADAWVRIRDVSGAIHVEPSSGSTVEITGRKSWHHGDPTRVRIVAQRAGSSGADVIVCALWDEHDTCDSVSEQASRHGHWSHDDDDNDVSVDFTVHLPKGVNVGAATVNGDIGVAGATGRVESATVNGSVDANTLGGPVDAKTVNGDVRVQMGSVTGAPRLDYSTVNGSVTVYLPATLGADVELTTVNGDLESDFPLTMSGQLDPHRMHGTIGGGGVELRAHTVNGSIALRHAAA
jgi:hypothetical protein